MPCCEPRGHVGCWDVDKFWLDICRSGARVMADELSVCRDVFEKGWYTIPVRCGEEAFTDME